MAEKFLEVMGEALDKDPGEMAMGDVFRDYPEWDSLAVLSIMATIEENYSVVLSRSDLEKCVTMEDLYKLFSKQ